MRAAAVLVLALAAARPVEGKTIRQIELRGNARILAADVPVRRGRLYLFHRYPDGVYMSVPAEDVLGVATTTVEVATRPPDVVHLGETGEGGRYESPAAAAHAPMTSYYEEGYPGYYGWGYWPCFGCNVPSPPVPPKPGPPSLVGPNGFPLLPGSPPPAPIGPNGFPIISPQPQPPVVTPH